MEVWKTIIRRGSKTLPHITPCSLYNIALKKLWPLNVSCRISNVFLPTESTGLEKHFRLVKRQLEFNFETVSEHHRIAEVNYNDYNASFNCDHNYTDQQHSALTSKNFSYCFLWKHCNPTVLGCYKTKNILLARIFLATNIWAKHVMKTNHPVEQCNWTYDNIKVWFGEKYMNYPPPVRYHYLSPP